LMLLSARIFCGYRGVSQMQIFAWPESSVATRRKFAETGQRLECLQTPDPSVALGFPRLRERVNSDVRSQLTPIQESRCQPTW
jgi:hypothetical protein